MTVYYNDLNQQVTLNKAIKSGGEGSVYGIVGLQDKVAKIYHPQKLQDDHDLAQKLQTMVAYPPDDPMKRYGHISIAWPESRLLAANGQFAGYLMPRIQQPHEIFEFYNPAVRQQQHPGVTWKNLHAIARNLAAALAAVHARDYVVGDLNEGNIFVNDQSLVTLIDTDSFQVRDPRSGWVYRCNVGKGAFTPVELQGLDLKSVDRQPYHDLFGLGVLLFHLLMEGYHPFTGVSRSQASISGQTVFERNIGQGNFPYHPGSSFLPPPAAPTYNILHPQLQAMFRRCFLDGHKTPSARPTAREWHRTIQMVENSLVQCRADVKHWYSPHLTECPWCLREKALAVMAGTALAGAGGPPLQTQQLPSPPPQPRRQPQQSPRQGVWGRVLTLLLIGAALLGVWQIIGNGPAPEPVIHVTQVAQTPSQVDDDQQAVVQTSPTDDDSSAEPAVAPGVGASTKPSATATLQPTNPPPTLQPANPPPTPRPTNPPPTLRPTNSPPTATPERAGCQLAPSPRWVNMFWASYETQLGCPTTPEFRPSDFAFQYYERGTALWREDLDRIYILYFDNGTFSIHRDDEGPEGYFESPLVKGGFGYLWNNNQTVRDRLGQPLAIEMNPVDFAVQDFTGGVLIYFDDNGSYHFALFSGSGTWVED